MFQQYFVKEENNVVNLSTTKDFRKSFIVSAHRFDNSICILRHINRKLKSLIERFKDKSAASSHIIDFENINYGYWTFISEVYMLCKKNNYILDIQLEKLNFAVESEKEKAIKDPDQIADMLKYSHNVLVMDNNNVVIYSEKEKLEDSTLGNTDYISIRAGETFLSKNNDYNFKNILSIVKFIPDALDNKYWFYTVGSTCCTFTISPDADLEVTEDGFLISWNVKPSVIKDVIYCLSEDKFYIVLIPWLTLSDTFGVHFVVQTGSLEHPEIGLEEISFEPFELDLDKLKSFDIKGINEELKIFEEICTKLKPILMNAAISLTDRPGIITP
jgi:hypothetical protein